MLNDIDIEGGRQSWATSGSVRAGSCLLNYKLGVRKRSGRSSLGSHRVDASLIACEEWCPEWQLASGALPTQ